MIAPCAQTGGQGAAYADRGLIPRVIDRTFQLVSDHLCCCRNRWSSSLDSNRYLLPAASVTAAPPARMHNLQMDEERHASATSPTPGAQGRLSSTSGSRTSGARGGKGGSRKRVLRSSTLSVSYLEIYNEQLYDLLSMDVDALTAARAGAGIEGNHTLAFGRANDGAGATVAPSAASAMPELTITEDKQGGTHVRGLTRVPVRSAEEALSSLFEGDANRAVAEHALNAASTRSHCVFTLYLERVYSVRTGAKNGESDDEDDTPTETVRSKLHLVDLAGSERIGKTHTAGGTAVQASFINKSLTFLEQVVLALLSSKREHVPYRSSKLTNMLKDSLGGNCRTRMVACVWPDAAHAEESVATLRFATRMMKVKTFVSRNVASSGGGAGGGASSAQVAKLESEIKALRRELAMHDALVGRTGVRYGPITPAEGGLIADLCEAYVDAPSDEEEEEGGVSTRTQGGAQSSLSNHEKDAPGAARSLALPHSADGSAVSAHGDSAVYEDETRKLHSLAPAQLHEARLLQVTTMRQVAAAFSSLRSLAREAKREAREARREARQGAGGGLQQAAHAESDAAADDADDASPRDEADQGVTDSPPPQGAAEGDLASDATAEEAHLQWKAGAGAATVKALEASKQRLLEKKAESKRIAKSVNACKKRIDGLVAQLSQLPPAADAQESSSGEPSLTGTQPAAAAGSGSAAVRSARGEGAPADEKPPSGAPSSPGAKIKGESGKDSPQAAVGAADRPSSASSSKSGGAILERGTGGDTPADAVRGVEGGSSAQGKHEFTWDKEDAAVKNGTAGTSAEGKISEGDQGGSGGVTAKPGSRSSAHSDGSEREQKGGTSARLADSDAQDSKRDSPKAAAAAATAAGDAGAAEADSSPASRRTALVRDISVAKHEYRDLFAQLKAVKSEVAFLTQQLGGLKTKALKEFDAWLSLQRQQQSAADQGPTPDSGRSATQSSVPATSGVRL